MPCASAISFRKYFDIITIPAIFAIPLPAPDNTPSVKHNAGILVAKLDVIYPSIVRIDPITVAHRAPTLSQINEATGPIIRIIPVASELIQAV